MSPTLLQSCFVTSIHATRLPSFPACETGINRSLFMTKTTKRGGEGSADRGPRLASTRGWQRMCPDSATEKGSPGLADANAAVTGDLGHDVPAATACSGGREGSLARRQVLRAGTHRFLAFFFGLRGPLGPRKPARKRTGCFRSTPVRCSCRKASN